jgi:5-methyltetrahydropteroyltriglutamate--homocysteine methyltransferase
LRDVPQDMVRHHICWGSQHGPHKNDIPLEHIVDIVLKSHSECLSIEAANPVHEDEWTVWESVKLPDGKTIMPGCVGHVTDLIERPNLVAQRLVRYANLVGKENVVAGTDCGIGSRVGNGEIAWAKLASLAEGARIASEQLWG